MDPAFLAKCAHYPYKMKQRRRVRLCSSAFQQLPVRRSFHKPTRGGSPRLSKTAMQNVRRLILYLSSIIGVWVLISFGGAMVDSGNAAFWSSSLMWSLLSFLVVMPALVLINHASTEASRRAQATARQQATPKSQQKPFVQEESDEVRTLWPEPEQKGEWPPQDVVQEQERVRT